MGEDAIIEKPGTDQEAGFAARCLLRRTCWASLATQRGGQPAASLVTHAIAPDGAVLMLLSALSGHARQLENEPRCGLMVTGQPENLNWQTAPRLSVTGTAVKLDDTTEDGHRLRRIWVTHHPYAKLYADFSDFSVWRLLPAAGLYVAGFGRIHKLSAASLTCPADAVAALAAAQDGIVAHCNRDHASDLSRLAHATGHAGRWSMLGVDPDGFDLAQDETVLRIAFDAPVQDGPGVRAALLRLLKAERNGQLMG
jgi:putative heme iron utilization protein